MTTETDRARTPWGVHLAALALLTAAMGAGLAAGLSRTLVLNDAPPVEGDRIATVQRRIDPNTAGWEDLSRLPGVGESLAKAIVRYREERQAGLAADDPARLAVFRTLADLDPVPGVGEVRLQRMAPLLRFPPSGTTAAAASAPQVR